MDHYFSGIQTMPIIPFYPSITSVNLRMRMAVFSHPPNSVLPPLFPDLLLLMSFRWMMYHKALHFNDIPTSIEILETTNPRIVKSLGRKVKNFDEKEWNKVKFNIVIQGNVLKFSRGGKELREQLERTGERELVEASPYDKIWGIGIKGGVKECQRQERDGTLDGKRKEWGKNLLGLAMVEARRLIREKEKNER